MRPIKLRARCTKSACVMRITPALPRRINSSHPNATGEARDQLKSLFKSSLRASFPARLAAAVESK